MLFYRAALPLSTKTLNHVAGIIRRCRKALRSRWRKLAPARQALLVLAYLRKGDPYPDLAAGFGVGTATAWRYVNETVDLLATRAPKLRKAARDARNRGFAYVVVDGTLIAIDRVAADKNPARRMQETPRVRHHEAAGAGAGGLAAVLAGPAAGRAR